MKSQKGFCSLRKRTDDMFAMMIEYESRRSVSDLGERDESGY